LYESKSYVYVTRWTEERRRVSARPLVVLRTATALGETLAAARSEACTDSSQAATGSRLARCSHAAGPRGSARGRGGQDDIFRPVRSRGATAYPATPVAPRAPPRQRSRESATMTHRETTCTSDGFPPRASASLRLDVSPLIPSCRCCPTSSSPVHRSRVTPASWRRRRRPVSDARPRGRRRP
jgi:hypothetical protein